MSESVCVCVLLRGPGLGGLGAPRRRRGHFSPLACRPFTRTPQNQTQTHNPIISNKRFIIAFSLIALIGVAVAAATGWLALSALAWLAWWAILSVLLILQVDSFLGSTDYSQPGTPLDFSRLTTAGWVLMAIAALGLAFVLGHKRRGGYGGAGGGGPPKY